MDTELAVVHSPSAESRVLRCDSSQTLRWEALLISVLCCAVCQPRDGHSGLPGSSSGSPGLQTWEPGPAVEVTLTCFLNVGLFLPSTFLFGVKRKCSLKMFLEAFKSVPNPSHECSLFKALRASPSPAVKFSKSSQRIHKCSEVALNTRENVGEITR